MVSQQVPLFSAEAVNAIDLLSPVKRVIDSYKYILGDEVKNFESEFADYCGAQYCVSVANGTDALELGLRALGVQRNDQVLLVANAAYYGSTAVRLIGALPYYVDIDPSTLTMSVDQLKQAIAIKPKAIIVTHLYGQLADIENIVTVANKAGIPVLEDCAQAHGATRNGKRAGSFGALGCFSFYPTKNLGALGDGGAVVTSDESNMTRLKQLRQYGWGEKYHVDYPGGRNSRLDEMQAAILRKKLPHLDRWNEQRHEIAAEYNKAFCDLPLVCPSSLDKDYVAHLYVVQVEERQFFRDHLKERGVATDTHYPIPDYLQKAYQSEFKQGSLPITEKACNTVVSLPCFPGMTEKQIQVVIDSVHSWFESSMRQKNARRA